MTATPELALHLGVHRTGTTALQQLLQRNSEGLAAAGIGFWGPKRLRGDEFAGLISDRVRERRLGLPTPRSSAFAAHVARAARVGRRLIVISEENLIGTIGTNLSRSALYPTATERLAAFADLMPVTPARIVLTLRDFAEYWRSAYAQALGRAEVASDPAASVAVADTSWLPLLRSVREVFPAAPLLLARHRAEPDFIPALLSSLLGRDVAAMLPDAKVRVNASLPAETLTHLRGMSDGRERERFAQQARQAGGAPIDPFPEDVRQALSARFEAEWAEIEAGAIAGVTIIARPDAEVAR